MTRPQWSRPGTGSEPGTPFLFIRGVRPNSPITITIVESSRPRSVEVLDQAWRRSHRGSAGRAASPSRGSSGSPSRRRSRSRTARPPRRAGGPAGRSAPTDAASSGRGAAGPPCSDRTPAGRLAEDHRERLLLESVEARAERRRVEGAGGPARRHPAGCVGPPAGARRRRPATRGSVPGTPRSRDRRRR